jgi:hypothetical protein
MRRHSPSSKASSLSVLAQRTLERGECLFGCPPLFQVSAEVDGARAIDWNFSDGQWRAIESLKRFILALAGWQSGKSEIGPPWLLDEMVRMGPGDYLVASPTFPLMLKKVLPIFLRLFDRLMQLGHFVHGKNIFLFSDAGCRRLWGHVPEDPPRVLFGHAGDPDSLTTGATASEAARALRMHKPKAIYVVALAHGR